MVEKKNKSSEFSGDGSLGKPKEKDVIAASALLADQLLNDKRFDKKMFAGFGTERFNDGDNIFYAATVHLAYRPSDEVVSLLPTAFEYQKSKKKSVTIPIVYSISGEYQIEDGITLD